MKPDLAQPVVQAWLTKINKAIEKKKAFQDVADQCMAFFSESCGFMWEDKYRSRFMQGSVHPRFKLTMQKAFEMVAVFGPSLYWRNPQRVVAPRQGFEFPTVALDAVPQLAQMYQQYQQEQTQNEAISWLKSQLMQQYLNYTPGEQPGGGLANAAEVAIIEALVKGRGCLWVEPYSPAGSDTVLTGSFQDSVDNLLIDPDAESLEDAWWIARKCCHPSWYVEREYGLRPGSLKGVGTSESSEMGGMLASDDLAGYHRKKGETFDLITYYRIWSKGGVGGRLSGIDDSLREKFEDVGDHAYLVVSQNVPFPLNAPPRKMKNSEGREFRRLFEWPIPFWADDLWPVCCLDFYQKPRSPWPIAPMAPGLGELIFINTMVSHLANRIWSSSRTLVAYLKSASKEVESILKRGNDLDTIGLDDVHGNINQVISFLQQPDVTMDVWRIIEMFTTNFEKRTGLYEDFYAKSGGGPTERTATESRRKQQMAGLRPEWMASKVEDWMGRVARMEKLCAWRFVEGRDISPLLGRFGAQLWDQFISNADPETVLREMEATVEAGSARKPNKDRDLDNINAVAPTLLPLLQQTSQITTDPAPLNAFFQMWGDALEMKGMKQLRIPQLTPPPPSPEEQQAQQQMAQMEQQKIQADVQKASAAAQKAQMDAQAKQMDAQVKAQLGQQKMQENAAKAQMDQQSKAAELFFKQQERGQELQYEKDRFEMQSLFDTLGFEREDQQDREVHDREMEQMTERGKLDLLLKRKQAQQAAKKPQQNGSKT